MKPGTAYKLWCLLDAVSNVPELEKELSPEEWVEIGNHVSSLVTHCRYCGEVITDPLTHPCSRDPRATIV